MTFVTLPEPIRITDPVEVTFTEYHVYGDIVMHIAKSTRDSLRDSGITPESFVLREMLQNAIDAEILKMTKSRTPKLEDFLWAYKKVKIQDVGKWKLIENEGTLTEDIFLFGYSTKEEEKKEGCRLVGRFGVGLKESIFMLLYDGKHMLMAFNGRIYGFGYYYNGKVYYDLDLDIVRDPEKKVSPVILRGQYNIRDKVLVYVPATVESEIPLLYPYEKPYHVSSDKKGHVYHNGLYSGAWGVPLDVNVCNVSADQYRKDAYISSCFINALQMIVDDEMSDVFREILLKYAVWKKYLLKFEIPVDFKILFSLARDKLRDVLQKALIMAVDEKLKEIKGKIIIVDRVNSIKSDEVAGIGLPDIETSYIDTIKSYLIGKGYQVFSYSEAVSGKFLKYYNDISEQIDSVEIRALVRLAEWLYSIGVKIMEQYKIPGYEERLKKIGTNKFDILDPIPGIFDTDVRIVKEQYKDMFAESVGETVKVGNEHIIILNRLEKDHWLLYVGIMLHELNHIYSDFEHGTFQWENIYNVLYMVDILAPDIKNYVINLIRLAVYNPELFLKVNNIKALPNYVLPRELIENEQCLGYIDNERIKCDLSSFVMLKLINDEGMLKLEVESV